MGEPATSFTTVGMKTHTVPNPPQTAIGYAASLAGHHTLASLGVGLEPLRLAR